MNSLTWSDAQALAYIASYSDLRSAFGINAAAGRSHYTVAGAAEGRTIAFDPYAYLSTYSDLRVAFGADVAAATQHYILYGASEGRTVSFDAYGYLATYSDLRGAFGSDTAAATRHYALYGASEGRTISFDAMAYLATYSDLRGAFGSDTTAATRHYALYGASEGRTVSFDGLSYIASYSDLRAVFRTDATAATRHFVETGASEGRVASFDRVAYLLSNSDLGVAGYDASAAIRHWILHGANEGRSASGAFGTEQASHNLPTVGTITGAIDRSGDRDWFKIDLAAGKGISFDFFPSNGNGMVTIHDANGRAVTPSESVGARTSFLAGQAGTYYVIVSTANSSVGNYSLTVVDGLTITGTSANDTLTGTDGADTIRGLEGSDTLNGRGGNDVLEGGSGYDQLDGGLGDDVLYGNNAANAVFDSGDYLTDSQGGNDQLFGQDGDDHLSISRFTFNGNIAASTVLLDGGAGNDSMYFSASSRFLDTVTIIGGAGNDTIGVGSVLRSTINAGDGNDKVTIGLTGGDQTITLGAGADVLTLESNANAIAIGNPTRITDFQTGTDVLSLDQYLASVLINWDRASNPFGTNHLKLVQSDTDTLLQIDRDGSANGYALATLLTLSNTTAANFTARDLGYAPDGSAAAGLTITGTSANDTLTGTDGADTIRGLEGSDTLNGRGGNDVLEGGSGYDQLDGGLGDDVLYGNNAANAVFDSGDYLTDSQGGNDQLFGQDGDDHLSISRFTFNGNIAASTVLLDGGAGNDSMYFSASSRFLDTVTIIGGAGNDTIGVGSVLRSTINAGDGNDKVTIGLTGGDQTITLGAGADVLTLESNANAIAIGNPTRITDFQTGTDVLSLDQYLASVLINWDRASNPFGTNHLKLVQSDTDTLLQIDRDGSANGYALATLLTLSNTTAANFTARDLGYAPDGSAAAGLTITGTSANDTLTGTDGADTIRGLEGSDTLNGRGGNDVLEGGSGYDQLDGGLGDDVLYGNNAANAVFDSGDYLTDSQGGNDQLFGQDGDDHLSISRFTFNGNIAASTVLLDGGAGNDSMYFSASSRFLDTVTIIGGAGNDTIGVGSVLRSTINAGDGNDKVTIGLTGGDQTITLGAGADVLTLESNANAIAIGNPTRITDFQTGTDVLSLDQYLASVLINWDRASNPFGTNHLKLVQSDTDTLLQIDRDGSANGYALATLLTLSNTTAANFTARDLGYAPLNTASMTADIDKSVASISAHLHHPDYFNV